MPFSLFQIIDPVLVYANGGVAPTVFNYGDETFHWEIADEIAAPLAERARVKVVGEDRRGVGEIILRHLRVDVPLVAQEA